MNSTLTGVYTQSEVMPRQNDVQLLQLQLFKSPKTLVPPTEKWCTCKYAFLLMHLIKLECFFTLFYLKLTASTLCCLTQIAVIFKYIRKVKKWACRTFFGHFSNIKISFLEKLRIHHFTRARQIWFQYNLLNYILIFTLY